MGRGKLRSRCSHLRWQVRPLSRSSRRARWTTGCRARRDGPPSTPRRPSPPGSPPRTSTARWATPRAETISSFVERRLLDPSESVTFWNADAVVVFAADPTLIGTQDRRLRSQISRVLSNGTQTETTDGSVHIFVAVAVGEGDGTPVVAEVIRPDEASSAGRPWIYASIAAGFLAFLALVAAIRTSEPSELSIQRVRRRGTTCAGTARTCCRRRRRSSGRGRRTRT